MRTLSSRPFGLLYVLAALMTIGIWFGLQDIKAPRVVALEVGCSTSGGPATCPSSFCCQSLSITSVSNPPSCVQADGYNVTISGAYCNGGSHHPYFQVVCANSSSHYANFTHTGSSYSHTFTCACTNSTVSEVRVFDGNGGNLSNLNYDITCCNCATPTPTVTSTPTSTATATATATSTATATATITPAPTPTPRTFTYSLTLDPDWHCSGCVLPPKPADVSDGPHVTAAFQPEHGWVAAFVANYKLAGSAPGVDEIEHICTANLDGSPGCQEGSSGPISLPQHAVGMPMLETECSDWFRGYGFPAIDFKEFILDAGGNRWNLMTQSPAIRLDVSATEENLAFRRQRFDGECPNVTGCPVIDITACTSSRQFDVPLTANAIHFWFQDK